MKSSAPSKALRTLLLPALLILTGCSGMALTFGPTAPVATTDAGKPAAIPLACYDFPPMTFSIGKHDPGGPANATVADVQAALADPVNPLGAARYVLGDTLTTRVEVDDYMGRRKALGCPDPAPPAH